MTYVIAVLCAAITVLGIIILMKQNALTRELQNIKQDIIGSARATAEMGVSAQNTRLEGVDRRLEEIRTATDQSLHNLQESNAARLEGLDRRFETIRLSMEGRLTSMQESNEKKLDQMRNTVDEKLQKTLEERIGQSFRVVSERLEQVYKGLGEMQALAVGVGDLKKVLSNVKTRGILGEIQLGAILEEILPKEQYEVNVTTVPGSREPVEYAIRLPGSGDEPVYLPIDSKFPADVYSNLCDAYDAGIPAAIEAAGKLLDIRIKAFAKDIHTKYISPPHTTDFGIMFLPFEGLYAEVVRRGLIETLQKDYKINIAGPTTMAALLNSLQMGFRTLAIQKRSGEIWNILGAVKTEFDTFGTVLEKAQEHINSVNKDLDQLVGVRTRQIQRRLRNVTGLQEAEAAKLLDEVPDEE